MRTGSTAACAPPRPHIGCGDAPPCQGHPVSFDSSCPWTSDVAATKSCWHPFSSVPRDVPRAHTLPHPLSRASSQAAGAAPLAPRWCQGAPPCCRSPVPALAPLVRGSGRGCDEEVATHFTRCSWSCAPQCGTPTLHHDRADWCRERCRCQQHGVPSSSKPTYTY